MTPKQGTLQGIHTNLQRFYTKNIKHDYLLDLADFVLTKSELWESQHRTAFSHIRPQTTTKNLSILEDSEEVDHSGCDHAH